MVMEMKAADRPDYAMVGKMVAIRMALFMHLVAFTDA